MNSKAGDALVTDVKGVKLVTMRIDETEMNELRNIGDKLKNENGEGVVFIVSACGGKANLLAMASDAAVAKGAHAGNLIKAVAPIVSGGGGGRPNMAQAGGKDPSRIDECLTEAVKVLEGQIN